MVCRSCAYICPSAPLGASLALRLCFSPQARGLGLGICSKSFLAKTAGSSSEPAFCSVLGAWPSLALRLLLCKSTCLFKEILAKDCWKDHSAILFA